MAERKRVSPAARWVRDDLKPKDPTAAERQRRYRERKRGTAILFKGGQLPAWEVEVMLEAGWITDEESRHPEMLRDGMLRVIRRKLHRGDHG